MGLRERPDTARSHRTHDHHNLGRYSTDGRTALSAGGDETLKVWDLNTGKLTISFTFEGQSRGVISAGAVASSVAIAPDGRTALSANTDGTLELWDLIAGRVMRTFPAPLVFSVVIAPDGRTALSGSSGDLQLWDIATGGAIRSFVGHTNQVLSVAIAPDGRFAVSGSRDRTLKLWDVARGTILRTFTGHAGAVTSVAFAPDGGNSLSGSTDHTVRLWTLT